MAGRGGGAECRRILTVLVQHATRMAIGPAGRVITFPCTICTEPTGVADEVGHAEVVVQKDNQR